MGEVHRFGVRQHVAQHGKKSALNAGLLRIAVDASSGYQGDEQGGLNFVYSGLCQAFLPHKALPDDEPWLVENEFCSLMVQPGHKQVGPNKTAKVGVPYGSRARVVLLYLQTEAQRTGKRQVELGGSLRAWARKSGPFTNGGMRTGCRSYAKSGDLRCKTLFQNPAER